MARMAFEAFPRAVDANGSPVSGGFLYVYEAGTTTDVTSYSDLAMATPHAQPVVADSAGFFPQIYLPAGSYKVVLKTPAGVTIDEADNVVQPQASTDYSTVALLLASTELSRGTGAIWHGGNRAFIEVASGGDEQNSAATPVELDEFGHNFSTLARFKAAVARGDSYVAGDVVRAATASYRFLDDANTDIEGLTGWSYFTRERLTGSRTYYVRKDGADTNDGLADTAGGAFLTIGRATDVVFETLDLNNNNVTISVGDGTYTESVYRETPHVGPGRVIIIGDETTPGNVIVDGDGSSCFQMYYGATVWVQGFKLTSSGSRCLYTAWGGHINFDHIDFGAATIQIRTSKGSIWCVNDKEYTISASATYHINCHLNGAVDIVGATATLTGTPVFTQYIRCTTGGTVNATGNTYVGSGTGTKFYLASGGSMDIAGDTLPVPSAGQAIQNNYGTGKGNLPPVETGRTISIADDDVYTFDLDAIATGICLVTINTNSGAKTTVPRGIFAARAPSAFTENISLDLTKVTLTTGALTGTTGVDTEFTISTHSDGNLYLENRTGGALAISFSVQP